MEPQLWACAQLYCKLRVPLAPLDTMWTIQIREQAKLCLMI